MGSFAKAGSFAKTGSFERGITISPAGSSPPEPAKSTGEERTPPRRPRAPDAPASAPADGERPTKPAKRPWSKPDFAKKGEKGKPESKGKKSFGTKGQAKYKCKAPK